MSSHHGAIGVFGVTFLSMSVLYAQEKIYDLRFDSFQCVGMRADGTIDETDTLSLGERQELVDTQNDPITGQPMQYLKSLRYSLNFKKYPFKDVVSDRSEKAFLQFLNPDNLGASQNGEIIFNADVRPEILSDGVSTGEDDLANIYFKGYAANGIQSRLVKFGNTASFENFFRDEIQASVLARYVFNVEHDNKADSLEKTLGKDHKTFLDLGATLKSPSSPSLNFKPEPLVVPIASPTNNILTSAGAGNLIVGGGLNSIEGLGSIAGLGTLPMNGMKVGLDTRSLLGTQNTKTITLESKDTLSANPFQAEKTSLAYKVDVSARFGAKAAELAEPIIATATKALKEKASDSNALLSIPYSSTELFTQNHHQMMRFYLCKISGDYALESN